MSTRERGGRRDLCRIKPLIAGVALVACRGDAVVARQLAEAASERVLGAQQIADEGAGRTLGFAWAIGVVETPEGRLLALGDAGLGAVELRSSSGALLERRRRDDGEPSDVTILDVADRGDLARSTSWLRVLPTWTRTEEELDVPVHTLERFVGREREPRWRATVEPPTAACWNDANQDGEPDLVLVVRGAGRGTFEGGHWGRARIVDGRNGRELAKLDAPKTTFAFGTSVATIGDQDGDRVTDLAIGFQDGVAFCSGATLAPLALHRTARELRWRSVPDLDGDGCVDLIAMEVDGRALVHAYWPATMQASWSASVPGFERSGTRDVTNVCASVGDVDRDGVRDVILGASDDSVPSIPTTIACVSGRNGRVMWSQVLSPRGFLSLHAWRDANEDGVDDLVLGLSDYDVFSRDFHPRVLVVSAVDGATLLEIR